MNVYDFDKTIYKKDSSVQFYLYCLKKKPSLIRYIFIQLWCYLKYVFYFIDKTALKEGFFSFLKGLSNIDLLVSDFWDKNERFINQWYLDKHNADDVVISASPEFLLLPICNKLGIKYLIASKVDKTTGKFNTKNCHDEEKLIRYKYQFGDAPIDNFYSDSLSDSVIANVSNNAYIVKGDNIIAWKEYHPSKIKRLKSLFISKKFVGFLIIGGINAINGVLFATLFGFIIPDANISFICGYIVSLTISYLLNSLLVFKSSLTFIKYIKFCISYIPNFLIQNGLVLIFYNLLHLNKTFVYIIAVIIAIPITFLALTLFTFKKK